MRVRLDPAVERATTVTDDHSKGREAVEHVGAGQQLGGDVLLADARDLVIVRQHLNPPIKCAGRMNHQRDVELLGCFVERVPVALMQARRLLPAAWIGINVRTDEPKLFDAPLELGHAVAGVEVAVLRQMGHAAQRVGVQADGLCDHVVRGTRPGPLNVWAGPQELRKRPRSHELNVYISLVEDLQVVLLGDFKAFVWDLKCPDGAVRREQERGVGKEVWWRRNVTVDVEDFRAVVHRLASLPSPPGGTPRAQQRRGHLAVMAGAHPSSGQATAHRRGCRPAWSEVVAVAGSIAGNSHGVPVRRAVGRRRRWTATTDANRVLRSCDRSGRSAATVRVKGYGRWTRATCYGRSPSASIPETV